MRKNTIKKAVAVTLATTMALSMAACNKDAASNATTAANVDAAASNACISDDSPYRDKGFDFTTKETVKMYAVGERPTDTDKVLEKLNTMYLEPWINTTLELEFISWGDLGTKYSLLLSGGDKVDLIYTSSWCNYNSEVGNGAFLELTPEWLEKYMPYSYPVQASESWDQISISGKIYAIPKNSASFTSYNVMAFRKDILDKYNITEINSWDSMKEALYTIADNESANGIYANGQRGSNEFGDHLWWQNVGVDTLASGFDFLYYTHGKEDLPDWDTDVFYKYTSDDCLKYYLEMAEMAEHGVWSPTRINDTSDPQVNFTSGKTATLIWNSAAISSGITMEQNGVGTFEVFDITPNAKARRDSYANDAIAIPASSKVPERAALVLDVIKGFPDVNNLVVGGIEGEHYTRTEDGKHINAAGSDAYPWGAWAWGLTGKDSLGEYSEDPRSNFFGEICTAKEYAPVSAGFSFDSQPVETELAVINSIVEEYGSSFNLGMFGADTEAKYNEFVGKLKAAGLDTVMEECKKQYADFCAKKGK